VVQTTHPARAKRVSRRKRGVKNANDGDGGSEPALQRMDRWVMDSTPPWKAGLTVALLVMIVGATLVVLIPELLAAWLDPPARYPPAVRTDWVDSLRTGLLGVIAFGSVAAWVTQYRQAVMARTADEYNDRLRQLAKDKWEQVAGIRDLENLAVKNKALRVQTLQMLAVYVREKAPRTEALNDVTPIELDKRGAQGKRRPEPGVQEALRVIGSHLPEWAPQPLKTKEDSDEARQDRDVGVFDQAERSADARAASLHDNYMSLADTAIDGASLRCARLPGLNLRRTLMRDIKLERADLSHARLRHAVLTDADLRRAVLASSNLRHAKLIRADLRGADLRGADLRDADLTGARLKGAHLWKAQGFSDPSGATGKPHCQPAGQKCRAAVPPPR
jgi:hypothetical protein